MHSLEELHASGEAPLWMTIEGYKTVTKGYLLKDETPRTAYIRVANAAATELGMPQLADRFYQAMWKGWLCPASPVFSNLGTERGFPISCFGGQMPDSVDGIANTNRELMLLSKYGGGVGIGMNGVRGRGAPIRGGANGHSEGVIPWIKILEVSTVATSQGGVRKGASSVNLGVRHSDFSEFLRMRKVGGGDVYRTCRLINHCAVIPDEFMQSITAGEGIKSVEDRLLWIEIMKTRLETGEPYLMFEDTVNKDNPQGYKDNNLKVDMTNICTEITLHSDEEHTFVCCLSSLNLAKYDEWKDTDLPSLAVYFLNGVINEFIRKATGVPGFERAVASAIKGRAVGVGVLGWHSLLQDKLVPFDSFPAMMLNAEIFSKIRQGADTASAELAKEFGEPEWCKGTGRYNTHTIAVAPTRSNSIIAGDNSFGIEPWVSNAYSDQTAKGIFIRRNKSLKKVLEAYKKDDLTTWKDIASNQGSVQHLDFLTEHEKEVFKTAYEINQGAIIRQAAQRQKFIDQSQSVNLFFYPDCSPKFFSDVHILAWELGVKTLYYVRSNSMAKADTTFREGQREILDECKACEG